MIWSGLLAAPTGLERACVRRHGLLRHACNSTLNFGDRRPVSAGSFPWRLVVGRFFAHSPQRPHQNLSGGLFGSSELLQAELLADSLSWFSGLFVGTQLFAFDSMRGH